MDIEKLASIKDRIEKLKNDKQETEQQLFILQCDLKSINLALEKLQDEATTIFSDFLQGDEKKND